MTILAGGCQCGAVRFRAEGVIRASICHCRMCQKATGNAFGPYAVVEKVKWTRGEPRRFQSSNLAARGFCAECGTPLTYEAADEICVTLGALDDPDACAPIHQLAPESAVGWFRGIETLPLRPPAQRAAGAAFNARVVSYQHPDHDTAEWPAKDQP